MAGIECGTQITVCEFPIHVDTYRGCSHGCKYCFAQVKTDISNVRPRNVTEQVRNFINGKRNLVTRWCDWKIPLHWGGLADPFQPADREFGVSLDLLKLFRETQYPFIVSTKGKLCSEEPYLSLLANSNSVVQISMACSRYDAIESGAPPYEERLEVARKLNDAGVKRVIARIQPYICECFEEIKDTLPQLKEVGVYGVTFEGMKFKKKKSGLVKVGGDWCYPLSILERDYSRLKTAAHGVGLAFYCAENRLRPLGDSTACCGCDGLKGFNGNRFNAVNISNGEEVEPTKKMCEAGTGAPFSAINQSAGVSASIRDVPLAAQMLSAAKKLR